MNNALNSSIPSTVGYVQLLCTRTGDTVVHRWEEYSLGGLSIDSRPPEISGIRLNVGTWTSSTLDIQWLCIKRSDSHSDPPKPLHHVQGTHQKCDIGLCPVLVIASGEYTTIIFNLPRAASTASITTDSLPHMHHPEDKYLSTEVWPSSHDASKSYTVWS